MRTRKSFSGFNISLTHTTSSYQEPSYLSCFPLHRVYIIYFSQRNSSLFSRAKLHLPRKYHLSHISSWGGGGGIQIGMDLRVCRISSVPGLFRVLSIGCLVWVFLRLGAEFSLLYYYTAVSDRNFLCGRQSSTNQGGSCYYFFFFCLEARLLKTKILSRGNHRFLSYYTTIVTSEDIFIFHCFQAIEVIIA